MQVRNFLRSLTLDHGGKATKLTDVLTLAKRVAGQMEGGPAVEDEEDTEASMELYSKLNKRFPKGGTEEQVRAAAHFKTREIETSDRKLGALQVTKFLRSMIDAYAKKASEYKVLEKLGKRMLVEMGDDVFEDEEVEDTEAAVELDARLSARFPNGASQDEVRPFRECSTLSGVFLAARK